MGDLGRHWRELLGDPDVPETLAMAADLRGCEMAVTPEELRGLVRTVIEPGMEGRRWVSALVVAEGSQRSLTDQFVELSRECGVTEVFTDKDAALAWLVEAIGPRGRSGELENAR